MRKTTTNTKDAILHSLKHHPGTVWTGGATPPPGTNTNLKIKGYGKREPSYTGIRID